MNLNKILAKSINLNLNSVFSKSMNLNLVFSKSMNLNLAFLKSLDLNLNSKIKNKLNGSNPTHNQQTVKPRKLKFGLNVRIN